MIPRMNPDPFMPPAAAAPTAHQELISGVMAKVYWWMALGLGLTGLTAMAVASSPTATRFILGQPFVFYGLVIGELVLVWGLSASLQRLSPTVAGAGFLLYAFVNGLTLAIVFLVYTRTSIASTFLVTGATFGSMAVYGTVTKRDLSGMGSFLFMGLIGLIIAMVVNIFLHSSMLYWLITFAGIGIFVGLTAYDTQKIRRMAASGAFGGEKLAIFGALRLYLDFINLFLMLLRLLGDRRR